MTLGDIWNFFQAVRSEIPRLRNQYGEPEDGDNKHWPRILTHEVGRATELELDNDDPALQAVAIKAAAISWCWFGHLTAPKDEPEAKLNQLWHVARDLPAPIRPLCGQEVVSGLSVMRTAEYLRQPDPYKVFGNLVCETCASLVISETQQALNNAE